MNRAEVLKIAKPINMKTWEVQGILDERKMVTRRIIKFTRENVYKIACLKGKWNETYGNSIPEKLIEWYAKECKPPYQVGDILYVREKFNDTETNTILYAADKDFIDYGCKEVDEYLFMESEIKWKPSIHMPKEAARIFLRVTDVRIERLQDITEEQAIKEGCEGLECSCHGTAYACTDCYNTGWLEPPQVDFIFLWNSTIKKQDIDKYGWDANPWVIVVEFERVEAYE